ncbi:MAG: hypothetical protein Q9208_005174 [Pyrenodesmia sp. 3 TL-2023]
MNLIYDYSSVPVPRIYDFSATTSNPLKCPYILMQRIDGAPLHLGWFNEQCDPESLIRFRERATHDIAKAIVQLNVFTYTKIGSLQWNAGLMKHDVGAYRKVDHFADEAGTTFTKQGPFIFPEEYFLCSLNEEDATQLPYEAQAERLVLRLLIKWFFEATGDSSNFVLAHPDFNVQNIMVAEDGSLRGFVDWDGAATVPQCIGCEAYPLWLAPDWDPAYWNYDPGSGPNPGEGHVIDENKPVMVPGELNHYRALYTRHVEAALRDLGSPYTSQTKISGLARSLYIAANEPGSLPSNVNMILEKTMRLTKNEEFEDLSDDDNDVDDEEHKDIDIHPPGDDVCTTEAEEDNGEDDFQCPEDIPTAHLPNSGGERGVDLVGNKQDLTAKSEAIALAESATQSTVTESQSDKESDNKPRHLPNFPSFPWNVQWPLYIPVFFILLMDWLQVPTLSLLAAIAVGVLFSDSRLVSNLLALLLSGTIFAGLINRFLEGLARKTTGSSSPLNVSVVNDADLHCGRSMGHDLSTCSELPPEALVEDPVPVKDCSGEAVDAIPSSAPPDPSIDTEECDGNDSEDEDEDEFLQRVLRKWAEDPLYDFGFWAPKNIFNAMLKGSLGEVRTNRLKVGFQRLLASLDDKYATFDGLTLSNP